MNAATTQIVKDLLAQGKSREEIKAALLAKGVGADSVDDVLDIMMPAGGATAAPSPTHAPVAQSPTIPAPPPTEAPPLPSPQSPSPSPAELISSPPPAQRFMNGPSATPAATPIVAAQSTVAPVTPGVPPRKKSKLKVIIFGLIIILLLAGGGAYAYRSMHQTTYQDTIQKFITAMQNKDKKTADSLESPAAKALAQKAAGTASIYDACQKEGQLCTASFSKAYLDKATSAYKDYTSSKGVKGKQRVFTIKQSLSGSAAGGQGCSSNSTSTLTISVIPTGNMWLGTTWQVDNIGQDVSASADLCAASGSTSDASSSFGSGSSSSADPTSDGSDATTGPDSLDDGTTLDDSTDTDTSPTNQN